METSTQRHPSVTNSRMIVAVASILAISLLSIVLTAYGVRQSRIVTRVEYRERTPACVSFAVAGHRCGAWISCECPGGTLRAQGSVVICECSR